MDLPLILTVQDIGGNEGLISKQPATIYTLSGQCGVNGMAQQYWRKFGTCKKLAENGAPRSMKIGTVPIVELCNAFYRLDGILPLTVQSPRPTSLPAKPAC